MDPVLPAYTIDRHQSFVTRNANLDGPRQSTVDKLKIIAKIVKKDLRPENYGNVQCEGFLAFREQLLTDAHNIRDDWRMRRERSSKIRKCWLTLTRKQTKVNKLVEKIENNWTMEARVREAEACHYTRSPGEPDLEDILRYRQEFNQRIQARIALGVGDQGCPKGFIVKSGFLRKRIDIDKTRIKLLAQEESENPQAIRLVHQICREISPPNHVIQRLAQSIGTCNYEAFHGLLTENVIRIDQPLPDGKPLIEAIMHKIHEVRNDGVLENKEDLTQDLNRMFNSVVDEGKRNFTRFNAQWFDKAIEYRLLDCAKALLSELNHFQLIAANIPATRGYFEEDTLVSAEIFNLILGKCTEGRGSEFSTDLFYLALKELLTREKKNTFQVTLNHPPQNIEGYDGVIINLALQVAQSRLCDQEIMALLISSLASNGTIEEQNAILRSMLATVVHYGKWFIDSHPQPSAEDEAQIAKLLDCIHLIANKEKGIHGEGVDFSTECAYLNKTTPLAEDGDRYRVEARGSVTEIAGDNERILEPLKSHNNLKNARKV